MNKNIKLKKFDLAQLYRNTKLCNNNHPVVLLIGKRETGKSVVIREILKQNYHLIDDVIVLKDLDNVNENEYPEGQFEHNLYDVLKTQRQKVINKMMSDELPYLTIIADYTHYNLKYNLKYNYNIKELFINGSRYHIALLLAIDYSNGIPLEFRCNADFVFIFKEHDIRTRRRLYEQYAGMFRSFEMFCSVLDSCTENFECMVIRPNYYPKYLQRSGYKLKDRVFRLRVF